MTWRLFRKRSIDLVARTERDLPEKYWSVRSETEGRSLWFKNDCVGWIFRAQTNKEESALRELV